MCFVPSDPVPSVPARIAAGSHTTPSRRRMRGRLRLALAVPPALMAVAILAVEAQGHPPDRAHQTVRPRIEVIPPIGHRVPDHRRKYNRPYDAIGRWAYHFAPSSQEAMSWHAAKHRGDYDTDCPQRVVPRYEYLKPWQAIATGPRKARQGSGVYPGSAAGAYPGSEAGRDSMGARGESGFSAENALENPLDHPYRTEPESDSPPSALDRQSEQDSMPDGRKLDPPKPRIEPMSERDFEF